MRYGELYTKHADHVRAFHSWISPAVAAAATRLNMTSSCRSQTKRILRPSCSPASVAATSELLRAAPIFLATTSPVLIADRQWRDAVVHPAALAASGQFRLPEQTAIAAVLFDMDAEIDALEAKLAKARDIKRGMMQELLTGRVRLV